MNKPKVSVLTPVYNTRPDHLREMVESVRSQTFGDFEFILLNDSPDNAELERQILSFRDPRIRYEKNDVNIGISASRNRLLSLARGEYVAILDHDDVCEPDRFEKEVRYLEAHPEVGVVSGRAVYFPNGGPALRLPQENDVIKTTLLERCCVLHTAAMLRKSVLDENAIRYEAAYSPSEDYMLWIRLMGVTLFHNLPDVLVRYRWDGTNTTNRQLGRMRDKTVQIKNVAWRDYPFSALPLVQSGWLKLFTFLPVVKVVATPRKRTFYLFGVLPILQWRRQKW